MADPAHNKNCKLCGLPVKGRKDGFCCIGCSHAYRILKEIIGEDDPAKMRLSEHYQKMQNAGVIPVVSDTVTDDIDSAKPEQSRFADEEMDSEVIKVENMWCPSCSWVIEKVVADLKGVEKVAASFHSDRVKVRYAQRLTSPNEIRRAIENLGYAVADSTDKKKREKRLQNELLRLGISIFFTANVMMFSFGLYQGFFTQLTDEAVAMVGLPIFIMATLVVFAGGYPIFNRAVKAALNGAFVMETLTALGAFAAFALSVFQLARRDIHMYFDTACMLITLVLLGKYIESHLKARAARGIEEVYELLPSKARVVMEQKERHVSIEGLEPGAVIRVNANEPVPADGVIQKGKAIADESRLTGEHAPVTKRIGDKVMAGSDLKEGSVDVSVTGLGSESYLGKMIDLMEKALTDKNPAERLADRIMAYFVPAIILIAFCTSAVLFFVGYAPDQAMIRAVTVLVIACPCALGIATPLAKVAAMGKARREGILVTNADSLEQAFRLNDLVLDKTGTVTHGRFEVNGIETSGIGKTELVSHAASIEAGTEHPIARAIADYATQKGIAFKTPGAKTEIQGSGVKGKIGDREIFVGWLDDIPEKFADTISDWAGTGDTIVFVVIDGVVSGAIRLGDRVRKGMEETVRKLKAKGMKTHLVSGDSDETTAFIAGKIGADEYAARALPAEKISYITRLQNSGRLVGMVGDGGNDAGALAVANVGFATGDALTVAKNASDITLVSFSGGKLINSIALSKTAIRAIKTNLGFALVYNIAALPAAMLGVVNPIIAVSLMLVSSLTVVGNSARLAKSE